MIFWRSKMIPSASSFETAGTAASDRPAAGVPTIAANARTAESERKHLDLIGFVALVVEWVLPRH
jgi:hypothetical protein